MSMPVGLDARLVGTAMCLLNPHPGNKILCAKSALEARSRSVRKPDLLEISRLTARA
jgi:hypothetical protein